MNAAFFTGGWCKMREIFAGPAAVRRVIHLVSIPMLAVCWFVPDHALPWTSWHGEAFAFLTLLAIAWVAALRFAGDVSALGVAVPIPVAPFILLALLVVAQTATGRTTAGTDAVIWFYIVLCVMALALGYAMARPGPSAAGYAAVRPPLWEGLALVLIFGGLVSTLIAFAQTFELWQESDWIVRMRSLRRPGANLAQPNHLATLLLMAMASVLYVLGERRIGRLSATLLWMLLSAGLAMTESRTGLLGLGALLLWWTCKRPVAAPQLSLWWGLAAGGGAVLTFAAWPAVFGVLHLVEEGSVQSRVGEGSLRFAVWPQLIEAVTLRPWWGWGQGKVAEAHNVVAHAYPVSEPYTYSHNLVLDLALWFGLPAALVLAGATAVWFWRRMRAANDTVTWYAMAVVLPLAVHSMLEYPFAYAYFLVPVMLAVGGLDGALGLRPLFRLGIRPAQGLLLLSTVLMCWSAVEYLEVEEDLRVSSFEALRVGRTPPDYERPRVTLLTQLGMLADGMRVQPTRNMPQDQFELVKRVALYYPMQATQYRYALALALNGQGAEAERQLQVLRAQRGERIYRQLREQLERRLDELHVARGSLPLS